MMCSIKHLDDHPFNLQHKPQTKSTTMEKSWTKVDLLEELATIESGLTNSLTLRPSKNTTKKLSLVMELKHRLVASSDDLYFPFNLRGEVQTVHTSCGRRILCVNQKVDEVIQLEHQLAEVLVFLAAEEQRLNNDDTCETDTVSCESSQEIESDNDVGGIKINEQGNENEPELMEMCISEEETSCKSNMEDPMVRSSSSVKKGRCNSGGILVKHNDNIKDDSDGCCTADTTRKKHTRRVSFCGQDTIRHIEKVTTIEDRLASARELIFHARMSREKIASPVNL